MEIEKQTQEQTQVPKAPRRGIYARWIKRPMDFLLALIALIVLGPLLLATAILVRIKLGAPVIFRQERPGLNEKIFTIYKFRTMTDDKDEKGEYLPDSQRLTKFGSWLRSTSIDELPELWNILKGDMSIVGPRPLMVRYLKYYTKVECLRHTIRPGLTGLAQINGRNYVSWDNKLALDVIYTEGISFKKDLIIIIKTIILVLFRTNIAPNTDDADGDLENQRN